MCELFGMSCQKPDRASESLSSFREFSRDNPDGWGVAYYQNGRAIIEKEPKKAASSEQFQKIVTGFVSTIVIAHIRYMTTGDVCRENCHPFDRIALNRHWVFAHNGTIPGIPPHPRSQGTTDSEQAFQTIIGDMEVYMDQSVFHGLYPAIKFGIKKIFERYSRAINFNFLLSDGSVLYAFSHHADKPLYLSSREKEYGGVILISTKKLQSRDIHEWRKIPKDKVLLLSDGRVLVLSDRL